MAEKPDTEPRLLLFTETKLNNLSKTKPFLLIFTVFCVLSLQRFVASYQFRHLYKLNQNDQYKMYWEGTSHLTYCQHLLLNYGKMLTKVSQVTRQKTCRKTDTLLFIYVVDDLNKSSLSSSIKMKQNRFMVALADQVNVSSATLFAPMFIVGTNYSSFQT